MPLPIAVGGVSLSSERLLQCPQQQQQSARGGKDVNTDVKDNSNEKKNDDDDELPYTGNYNQNQYVTWTICPKNEWQARVVISFYYDENENDNNRYENDNRNENEIDNENDDDKKMKDKRRKRMVEIRIQISPLIRSLSSSTYRETIYHLELLIDNEENVDVEVDYDYGSNSNSNDTDDSEDSNDSESLSSESESESLSDSLDSSSSEDDSNSTTSFLNIQQQQKQPQPPQVIFSGDRKKLIVLLFHPQQQQQQQQQQSSVIVFQLRKPRRNSTSNDRSNIPLPSYINSNNNSSNSSSDNNNSNSNINSNSSRSNTTSSSSSSSSSFTTMAASLLSPVIATNPTFVPCCWGITSICRIGDNNNDTLNSKCCFLALRNYDRTLIWIDTRSVQVISTASLPNNTNTNTNTNSTRTRRRRGSVDTTITSIMKTSPTSSYEKGLLVLIDGDDNGNGDDEECNSLLVAVEWNLKLTTEVQQSDESEATTTKQQQQQSKEKLTTRAPPRRSSAGNENGSGGGGSRTRMDVKLSSIWSPASNSNSNKKNIADVCFGALASVLCVVYCQLPSTSTTSASLGPRQRIAQVLTISNNTGELVPVVSLFLSADQVEQASSVADSSNNNNDDECKNYGTDLDSTTSQRLYGIEHDPDSDSFLISSMFGNKSNNFYWIGCVWNWRSNSIGGMIQKQIMNTTVQHQIWSRLYRGRDSNYGGGSHLVYINASLRYGDSGEINNDANSTDKNTYNKVIETEKRIVPVAVLSPDNSTNPGVFTERCSLLLARDHISFPYVAKKDSDPTMLELDWKISALPLSYTMSHGPPNIAIIGPVAAKSVAVSSAFGVCVMDTSNNKWKHFGSPNEERSFSVVAMTWWEGNLKRRKEHDKDDLLVAIIQTRNGEQFLGCWSSKRLDVMHQLLDTPDLEWKPGESQDPEPSWGIPLPKNIKVTNISILAEPQQDQFTCHGDLRRAVVLLYSPDMVSTECDYSVFRLQVFQNNVSTRPYYVMSHKILQASIKNKEDLLGPVTSAFVAGAWFRFDLRKLGGNHITTKEAEKEDFAITLGVNRTPGGMHALSIGNNLQTCGATLIETEVSKFQLSDAVSSHGNLPDSDSYIYRFVWNIELLNGEVLCWSVPSVVTSHRDQNDAPRNVRSTPSVTSIRRPDTKQPKGLSRPSLVSKENNMDEGRRWILGTICEVGSVSDWALQSSSGSQVDIALGLVPQSSYGCVLRSGQSSQKFSRNQLGDIDRHIFSSNILEGDMNSQSPFLMTPPAFATSLFTLFLEAASIRMDLCVSKQSPLQLDDLKSQLKVIDSQVQHRLLSSRSTDISMMVLRLIVFRSLELISEVHKRHSKDPSDISRSNLRLSQSLLSAIVDATRRCASNLQFASLFLEIGRQIEPSNLEYLFPLPDTFVESNSSKTYSSDDVLDSANARSVVDLFTICIDGGSLAASASALPLLTSKAEARYYCGLLLDEAIDNFVNNTDSGECNFDKTEEERRALGDFFRFGMKLEDAELCEDHSVISRDDSSVDTMDRSISDEIVTPETQRRSFICSLNTSSSILNYIVPSSMLGESEKQRMEDAIKREASTFIKRSLDDPGLDFAMLPPDWDNDSFDSPRHNNKSTGISSVGGLVGDALLDLLQSDHTDNNWKAMSAISKMILQEGVEVPSSYNLFCEVAEKAHPLDILSLTPILYDVNNGHEDSTMTTHIEEEISTCYNQGVTDTDADLIVDLALLLIDRILLLPLDDINDQAAMEIGLVFIVMVAGHVCGRSESIQNVLDQDCLLSKCYRQATTINYSSSDLTKVEKTEIG